MNVSELILQKLGEAREKVEKFETFWDGDGPYPESTDDDSFDAEMKYCRWYSRVDVLEEILQEAE